MPTLVIWDNTEKDGPSQGGEAYPQFGQVLHDALTGSNDVGSSRWLNTLKMEHPDISYDFFPSYETAHAFEAGVLDPSNRKSILLPSSLLLSHC